MKIYFSVNLKELLDAEAKMSLEGRLPGFAAETLSVSLRDKAESNARRIIGNGGFVMCANELQGGVQIWPDNTVNSANA